jgi:hypothetical protein
MRGRAGKTTAKTTADPSTSVGMTALGVVGVVIDGECSGQNSQAKKFRFPRIRFRLDQ